MTSITELSRLLHNLATIGTVAEVDTEAARCRVDIGQLTTTWLPWLTLRAGSDRTWWPPSTGEQVLIIAPGGEIAQGVVLTGINCDDHPAPDNRQSTRRVTFADGTEITYDSEAKALLAQCVGAITVTATGSISVTSTEGDISATAAAGGITAQAQNNIQATATNGNITAAAPAGAVNATAATASVTAATITLTGAVTINGPLALNGPLTAGPGAGGAGGATFTGDLDIQGSLTNNGKQVGSDLRVSGVTPGSGQSGNPV